jgi:hypothetical protein
MTLLPVLLPEGYTSKVSVNDKLAAGDVIAISTFKNKSALESTINVAFYFNISPQDISKILKKNLGDAISEGEVLAEKKGGLGKSSKKLISQFSGTVSKIDQTNGDVGISNALGETEKETLETIISPVDGIVDFCNNEKIVIKTDRDTILATDGLGLEAEGEVIFLGKLEETELNSEMTGKIILAESIDRISLFKAIGLDAIGIVIKSLEGTDFIDLEQKRITMPVMVVSEEDYKKLVKADKKKLYLVGKDKTIVIL